MVDAPSNIMTSVETVTATASLQSGQGIWGFGAAVPTGGQRRATSSGSVTPEPCRLSPRSARLRGSTSGAPK
jgi:hypothetical protein